MILSADLYSPDGTTIVSRLPRLLSARWLDELEDAGSWTIELAAEDLPDAVEPGHLVKFALGDRSDDYRFAGVIESMRYQRAGSGIEADQVVSLSGRGVRALLEDALVYPLASELNREFTTQTAGAIMKLLFDEAQARGALSGLSLGFTDTLDSNGAAYATTLTVDEAVGNTLYSVAARHQELAVDVWVDADLQVHYLNSRGVDRTSGGYATNPTVLRVGQNVTELAREVGGPIRNTVLVAYGESGGGTQYTNAADAASQSSYGRRETFLSMTSTADASAVGLAATSVLNSSASPADGSTIEVANIGAVPYIDFDLGDTVLLADIDGSRTPYKVRGITVQVDAAGNITYVPELGTARANLNKRLKNALARVERASGGGESLNATVDLGAIADDWGYADFGAGGAQLDYGTVLTYNDTLRTGTLDLDGTTYNFDNATGLGIGIGDLLIVTDVTGVVDKVAVGIYARVGSYTPIIYSNPQANSNFPYDGDALATQHNPPFLDITNNIPSSNVGARTNVQAWCGTGILGYAGRVVVMTAGNSASGSREQAIYDVETGSITVVTPPVDGSTATNGLCVLGNLLFVSTGNALHWWDSSTGVWTTDSNVKRAICLGTSGGRAWFAGYYTGGSPTNVWEVMSIDSSGTLSRINNPANYTYNGTLISTGGPSIFGRAKNGYLYLSIQVSSGGTTYLWRAATTGAASTLTFGNTTSAGGDLPFYAANTQSNQAGGRCMSLSDVDADGNLVYHIRKGTPLTNGFARVNRTTLAITEYTQVTSSTGVGADGEVCYIGGCQVVGSQVVLTGGIAEDAVDPVLGNPDSIIPCYWRTDGTTTSVHYDTSYAGLYGGIGTDFTMARAAIVTPDTTSNELTIVKNICYESRFTYMSGDENAYASGPSIIDRVTL